MRAHHVHLAILFGLLFQTATSVGYNGYSHGRITRLAIKYLQDNPNFYPETRNWFSADAHDEFTIQEILVRGNIDTDYRPDFWFNSEFHAPTYAVHYDSVLYTFTSIQHFLTVKKKGLYWKVDGFSYANSSKQGKDEVLMIPSVITAGFLSTTLGGAYPEFTLPGEKIPNYSAGFLGSSNDWKKLYFKGSGIKNVVFPPATVPADLAFQVMLASARAEETLLTNWEFNLPVISNLIGTSHLPRHFMRGEARGLPKALDALGMTLHLIQDMTVPQHTLGTLDLCHAEFEMLTDELEAKLPYVKINNLQYETGFYIGERSSASGLYDESMVASFLKNHLDYPNLDFGSSLSFQDRIYELALSTAKWGWAKRKVGFETTLPSGSLYTGVSCKDLINRGEIRQWVKHNFNHAIAFTVFVLEKAAHDYENRH